MTTYMFEIVSVTNRILCPDSFLTRIAVISRYVDRIVLREKDLSGEEYAVLAKKVHDVCGERLFIHNFPEVAKDLGIRKLHLTMPLLKTLSNADRMWFEQVGTSCHSVEEALEAERLGCTYIFAGHIFETECKKNVPGRGLDFLEKVVKSVNIPVYAIGGIHADNISAVVATGVAGTCIMRGLMVCESPPEYIEGLRGGIR